MTKDDNKKNFNMIWKIVIGSGILVSLFVGMFTVDNRFAKTFQLSALELELEEDTNHKFKLAEAETVKTMQGMQMQQQISYKTIMTNMLIIQKEALGREDARLRRQIQLYPNDNQLKRQLIENDRQRIELQKAINSNLTID